jgi:hypothetical protein
MRTGRRILLVLFCMQRIARGRGIMLRLLFMQRIMLSMQPLLLLSMQRIMRRRANWGDALLCRRA